MKRIVLFLMFLMMVLPLAESAIYMPLPINGKVTGSYVSGLSVTVTNLRTSKIQTTTTTGAGEFLVDAANFDDDGGTVMKYLVGDQFKIEILGCTDSAVCTKTVAYTGQSEIYSTFDIGGAIPQPCPDCNCGGGGGSSGCTYTESICKEQFPCETKDCPIPVTCETCPPEKVCEVITCPPEKICPTCPEPSSALGAIIAAIIVFLGGGGAVYFKFGRKTRVKIVKVNGIDKLYHQHETISGSMSGFHNPDTIHKVEPHKKGEILPVYEKDESGNWRYKG